MHCTKENPNKRAHDLNVEIKKNTQTATAGIFLLALISIFQLFNDSIFIFMPEEETAKQKLSGDI